MRYVLVMLGSLVGLVIVAYLLLYLLISVGCIYPPDSIRAPTPLPLLQQGDSRLWQVCSLVHYLQPG